MKNKYLYITSLFMFLVFLSPRTCAIGVVSGLELMMNILIPTLYPFIIISNLLIKIYGKSDKNMFFSPFLLCLICGYPIGAIMANELYSMGNKKKAKFLLNYCNLPSLMYISAYVFNNILHLSILYIWLFYAPIIVLSILNWPSKTTYKYQNDKLTLKNIIVLIDDCIYEGIFTILKISGYTIIFSMVIELIKNIHIAYFIKLILIGLLEMSNAINYINEQNVSYGIKIIFCLSVCAFGGLCTIFQTYSVIKGSNFSIKKYIIHKIRLTIIMIIFCFAICIIKGWL